jgi:hypothetical protein
MHVEFIESMPGEDTNGIVAEAEVHFDGDLPAPFAGKKLIGFTLRRSKSGRIYVNPPGRAFGVGIRRYYVNFIQDGNNDNLSFLSERYNNDELDDVKKFILKEWLNRESDG